MNSYIGNHNKLGQLRYWYYKKRGWVHGEYFVTPKSLSKRKFESIKRLLRHE